MGAGDITSPLGQRACKIGQSANGDAVKRLFRWMKRIARYIVTLGHDKSPKNDDETKDWMIR